MTGVEYGSPSSIASAWPEPAVAPASVGEQSNPARDRPARRAPGLLVLFRGGLSTAGEECFGIAVLARVARRLSAAGREQHQQTHCGERRQPVDVSRRQHFDHIATDDAARTRELGDDRRDVPEAQPARLRPPGSWGDAGIQPVAIDRDEHVSSGRQLVAEPSVSALECRLSSNSIAGPVGPALSRVPPGSGARPGPMTARPSRGESGNRARGRSSRCRASTRELR
jgi:hypothetical protein